MVAIIGRMFISMIQFLVAQETPEQECSGVSMINHNATSCSVNLFYTPAIAVGFLINPWPMRLFHRAFVARHIPVGHM